MGWQRRGIAAVAGTTLSVVLAHGLATLQAAWGGAPIAGAAAVLVLPIVAAGVLWWWKPSATVVALGAASIGAVLAVASVLPWGFLPLVVLISLVLSWIASRIADALPASVDGAWQRSRGKTIAWTALALVMLLQLSRLSAFMADRDNTWGSTFPPVEFTVTHMCMGSYVHAADLTRQDDPNVYSPEHYPSFGLNEAKDIQTSVSGLQQYLDDAFLYAPPFLLLPRLWLSLSNDYLNIRSVWFTVQFLAFATFAAFLARWVGGSGGAWALWMLPLVFASMPTMFNFQFGQAHLLTIGTAVGAMLAFDLKRPALGGALLAWGVASKIFPGVLILYLLFQKRWFEVAWTTVFGVALGLLAWVVIGSTQIIQFVDYMLPRLTSGDAFSFVTDTLPIVTNLSIPGTVWKLNFLGFENGASLLGVASVVYTLLLLVAIWYAARLDVDRLGRVQIWFTILILASLRSPIVPIYGAVPILWLMTLELGQVRTTKGLVLFGISLAFINGLPPAPNPLVTIALYGVAQVALLYWVVRPLFPGAGAATVRP